MFRIQSGQNTVVLRRVQNHIGHLQAEVSINMYLGIYRYTSLWASVCDCVPATRCKSRTMNDPSRSSTLIHVSKLAD